MYGCAVGERSADCHWVDTLTTIRDLRKGHDVDERIDDVAKTVAAGTTRRSTLLGLGAGALGALGILGASRGTEAKKNDNDCKQCKKKCKRNNRKPGKKNPNNCSSKCRNRCKNN
jgi:hypothetical protein